MSVQPIDLQTLLMRLGQIGKEQSAQRDAVIQSQTVAGQEIARRSEETESSVSETHTVDEGLETVAEKEENSGNREQRGGKHKGPEEEDREILKDPLLGQNIDLTG